MAKKIKFALKMKDGMEVRTLQELKSGFDLNAVMAYFLDGKLETWLSDITMIWRTVCRSWIRMTQS